MRSSTRRPTLALTLTPTLALALPLTLALALARNPAGNGHRPLCGLGVRAPPWRGDATNTLLTMAIYLYHYERYLLVLTSTH